MTFPEFKRQIEAAGLTAIERTPSHWQVVGGLFLVNYYPTSRRRTAYVNGTTRGVERAEVADVVRLAREIPAVAPKHERAARKNRYRREKRRLLVRDPHCHWCRAPLAWETATLDHVIPLARGGTNGGDNEVIACEPCNKRRGCDMPEAATGAEEGGATR